MSDWKPIETVPKDGTVVLCWKDGDIKTAWYKTDILEEFVLGGNGWSYASWSMPTHWRPMLNGPDGGEAS